ncbi:MAG: hypothetical protein NZ869_02585 [Thermoanaerobaculum sp.]|nr:hypothetical protein [Thermoanaerobaculum sp.]MDW7967366.1 hypothetical protein [Thermoanaerobaculum sp.]
MSERGFLVFRRLGVLWALPVDQVTSLSGGATPEIHLASASLSADEVLGVVPHLPLWPAPASLGRWWPHTFLGFSVFANQPLVVLQPETLPPMLVRGEA